MATCDAASQWSAVGEKRSEFTRPGGRMRAPGISEAPATTITTRNARPSVTRSVTTFRTKQHLIWLLAAHLLVGLAALSTYSNQINPDGVAYITTARLYAEKQWFEAVNGLWSPMLSWLMLPLHPLPIDDLIVAHVVVLLSGLGVTAGVWTMLGRLAVFGWLRTAVTGTGILLTLG